MAMSYCRSKFYIEEIRIFDIICFCDLDLDLMTFIYKPDPYSIEIAYTGCANMNFLYITAFESYRLTDIPTDRQTRTKFAGGQ